MRLPLQNKYTRVVRALLAEIESGAGLAVEISDGGRRIVSAQAPNEAPESVWWHAIPCSRSLRPYYWARAIKLLAFYFGAKFASKTLTHQRKEELAWNLAYSFEIFAPSWRKRLAQFLEVNSDRKRNFTFYHWLGERGFTIDGFFFCRDGETGEAITVEDDDILILGGTSWRYDIDELKKSKNACGFRLVCVIYDMLPIDYPSIVTTQQRERYKKFLYDVGRVADLIVTPNVFTAFRLKTFLAQKGISPSQVSTISLSAASLAKSPSAISQRLLDFGLSEKKFMLCVASLRDRKHILWLYSLCAKLRQDQPGFPLIVFAGRAVQLEILGILSEDPMWGQAGVFVEDPLDEELSWLYQNAQLYLQPSFEGGLGMPLMEAIKYGRSCIAADAPSLVEASGGLAEHLPHDERIWSNAIRRALSQGDTYSRHLEPMHLPSSDILSKIGTLLEKDHDYAQ